MEQSKDKYGSSGPDDRKAKSAQIHEGKIKSPKTRAKI